MAQNDNQWNFTPSLAASILFLVLFLLTTVVHLAQAIWYRKPYCAVIIISGLAQTLTYIFRTLSIQSPTNFPEYVAWFVLILVSPLLTNAFVYMVFGRMVWHFADDHQIWKIKAWNFGTIFVILDIIALIIQLYGAATAATSSSSKGVDNALLGLHVYMGGVGIQQFFILLFCGFAFYLFQRVRRSPSSHVRSNALLLIYTLFLVLFLITVRIIFRICEYSQGLKSTIPDHEAYQYCLDSLPMFIALVLFNVVHPGRVLPGDQPDMPGFSERKRQRKQRKSEASLELSSGNKTRDASV